jgi:hypothetical protein
VRGVDFHMLGFDPAPEDPAITRRAKLGGSSASVRDSTQSIGTWILKSGSWSRRRPVL